MEEIAEQPQSVCMELTCTVVSAYASNNPLSGNELVQLIRSVHLVLSQLSSGAAPDEMLKPAVPIKRSVTPDYIFCLEDGRKLKLLQRYLRARYKLTPGEYRAKWGLPDDYPMVAPNYSERRAAFAKKIGLGRLSKKSQKRQRS